MGNKAIIVSRGLHSPWNMGEAVLARNLVKILSKLYNNITVISTINEKRGKPHFLDPEIQELNIIFCTNEEKLTHLLKNELKHTPHADLHFVNTSIINYLKIIWRRERSYAYQFAYNPHTIMKALGLHLVSQYLPIWVVTTSPTAYSMLKRVFKRRYVYLPAPIDIPPSLSKDKVKEPLKIVYIGHGLYYRFPYRSILVALRKLKDDGYDFEFYAYLSKLNYYNYDIVLRESTRATKEFSLNDCVTIKVKNLDEIEKQSILSRGDIFLYLPLKAIAVDPPVAVLEAMAYGLCVVATPIQSLPLLLSDLRGITVSRKNLETNLYASLRTLLSTPKLCRELGHNAYLYVSRLHSINTISEYLGKCLDAK